MTSLNECFEKLHSTQELISDGNIYEEEITDYLHTMDGFLRSLVMEKCREQGLDIQSAMTRFINKNGIDKDSIEI